MSELKGSGIRKPKSSLAPDDDDHSVADGAPLSLAEEIAAEAARGIGSDDTHDRYEQIKQSATPTSPSCSGCRWPS